jgi:hypothetical protein
MSYPWRRDEQLLLTNLHTVAPTTLLGEALYYLPGQWPKLIRFLESELLALLGGSIAQSLSNPTFFNDA